MNLQMTNDLEFLCNASQLSSRLRLEIFSIVLINEGNTDFLEFPLADKVFKSVVGVNFKQFSGGLKPGALAKDEEVNKDGACDWSWDNSVAPPRLFVRSRFQIPWPRQHVNNALYKEVESLVANHVPPEAVDVEHLAMKYASSRPYVLLNYACAIKRYLSGSLGHGAALPGSAVCLAQQEVESDVAKGSEERLFVMKNDIQKRIDIAPATQSSAVAQERNASGLPKSSTIESAFDARFGNPYFGGKNFKQWCDAEGRELYEELMQSLEAGPSATQIINESQIWNEFNRYCMQHGGVRGGLMPAMASVGIEFRNGYYGLHGKPNEYWPIPHNDYEVSFSGVIAETESLGANNIILVKFAECIDDVGVPIERIVSKRQALPERMLSGIDLSLRVYGKFIDDAKRGIRFLFLTNEPLSRPGQKDFISGTVTENEFIERLCRYRDQSEFVYNDRDLIRFHTGVKLGLISILSGAPGCGKSSLVKLYSRALRGFSDGHTLLRVFVNPTWNQPADLIGEMDPLCPADAPFRFKPSGNGFYQSLVSACRDSYETDGAGNCDGGLYPVCFEEMNLTPVEYYFSDVIQIVGEAERIIPNVPQESGVSPEKSPLTLGDNVLLFGTCNNDSTTHAFSRRFLERSNYVELQPRVRDGGISGVRRASLDKIVPINADGGTRGDYCITEKMLKHDWLVNADEPLAAWEDSEQTLDKCYAELRKYLVDMDLAPSERVEEHMKLYILNRPGRAESVKIFQMQALDEALVQMVLPQLHVSSRNKNVVMKFEERLFAKENFGKDSLSGMYVNMRRKEYEKSQDY